MTHALNRPMVIGVALVALIAGFGLGVLFESIRNAPEAYEDEHGFHSLEPERPSVSRHPTRVRAWLKAKTAGRIPACRRE